MQSIEWHAENIRNYWCWYFHVGYHVRDKWKITKKNLFEYWVCDKCGEKHETKEKLENVTTGTK